MLPADYDYASPHATQVENPYNDMQAANNDQSQQQQQSQQQNDEYNSNDSSSGALATTQQHDAARRTFITEQQPALSTAEQQQQLSDAQLMAHVESQMLEYERSAQYMLAEKSRLTLQRLRVAARTTNNRQLEQLQSDDIRIFFAMIQQHQQHFDSVWNAKTLEHKLRADELIDALRTRHDEQQRALYDALRRKRLAKFSAELLSMRKRQVLLARSKQYIAAEKLKRKCDVLEQLEVERIRCEAQSDNQQRFSQLLVRQESERQSLAQKLRLEKKCLLEAKAQDFTRLKKRLKNAEGELKRTHIRQQMLADKKAQHGAKQATLAYQPGGRAFTSPAYNDESFGTSSAAQQQSSSAASPMGSESKESSARFDSRGSVLRASARRNIDAQSASQQLPSNAHRSARELARMGKPGNSDYMA